MCLPAVGMVAGMPGMSRPGSRLCQYSHESMSFAEMVEPRLREQRQTYHGREVRGSVS